MIATIIRMRKLSDGRVKILIQGEAKGRIEDYKKVCSNFEVKIKIEPAEDKTSQMEKEALIRNAKELLEKVIASEMVFPIFYWF